MPLFENNLSPYLTIVEATEPAAPSAGQQRLYIDSTTHLLKATNSSGTDRTIEGVAAGAITTSGLTQATARLLGRTTASTGAVEEITVGTGLSLSAGALTATGGAAGALVLLEQHDAAGGVASLDFTSFISSTYDEYMIDGVGIQPANNGVGFTCQVGTGGGPTYDTGSNYIYMVDGRTSGDADYHAAGTAGAMYIGFTLSNSGTDGFVSFSIRLAALQSTGLVKSFHGTAVQKNTTAYAIINIGGIWVTSGTAVTAIRFLMETGNIVAGIIRAYGIAK